MLGLMLLMAQSAAEVTPSLDSLTFSVSVQGTCITNPLQPAVVRLDWTSTGFVAAGQDFKVYRDGVLVATTDSTFYTLRMDGLVYNDTHNYQDIDFNYRVDLVRTSDGAVLATKSVSATKRFGNCV